MVVCDASQNDGGHRPAREDYPEHLHPSTQRGEREHSERARAEAPLDRHGKMDGHEHEQPHEREHRPVKRGGEPDTCTEAAEPGRCCYDQHE